MYRITISFEGDVPASSSFQAADMLLERLYDAGIDSDFDMTIEEHEELDWV